MFLDTVRDRRFRAWLFESFAVGGLIVVSVGILGLLAMSTARRVKEIGIRRRIRELWRKLAGPVTFLANHSLLTFSANWWRSDFAES